MRGPVGVEAARGKVLEPNEVGQHQAGVTNAEGGLLGPGPPGTFGGPAGYLQSAFMSGRECMDRTHQPPSSVQRCPGAVASRGCEHTGAQILASSTILHWKEPGLLGEMTDGSKGQDELGTSHGARKQESAQVMTGTHRRTQKPAEGSCSTGLGRGEQRKRGRQPWTAPIG